MNGVACVSLVAFSNEFSRSRQRGKSVKSFSLGGFAKRVNRDDESLIPVNRLLFATISSTPH